MIRFTKFDPVSGEIISYTACSHEDDVWAQLLPGQGFVLDWREPAWRSMGDEGFVRDEQGFLRTQEWLNKYWPPPQPIENSANQTMPA